MKKLLSKKIFVVFIAFFSAICIMLGASLITPRSVQADSNTPDYSLWKKTPVKVGNDLFGKYIAFDMSEEGDLQFFIHCNASDEEDGVMFYCYSFANPFVVFSDHNPTTGSELYLNILNLETCVSDGFCVVKIDSILNFESFVVDEISITCDGKSVEDSVSFYFLIDPSTASEYSTWEKTPVQVGDDLFGKYIAVNILDYEQNFQGYIALNTSESDDFISFVYLPGVEASVVNIIFSGSKISEAFSGMYSFPVLNLETCVADGFYVIKLDPMLDYESYTVTEISLSLDNETPSADSVWYYVLEEPTDTSEPSTDVVEPDTDVIEPSTDVSNSNLAAEAQELLDSIANWFTDNTGVAVSGSVVGIVLVGFLLFLFLKKR